MHKLSNHLLSLGEDGNELLFLVGLLKQTNRSANYGDRNLLW